MNSQVGDKVGDYEILQVLGAGGMGKVYKVRNVLSDRVEAMKVLLPGLDADPELAERFHREIKVQASMEHPNIASLHTAQRVGDEVLMIMEFVEGTPLDEVLRNGPVPIADGLAYISQVLSALAYAHDRGVVHRDIKPANIMLTPNGTVKLMDFGIAKLAVDQKLTQTGKTIGSLSYMSPEQIQGSPNIDARSDLYSLGICLYEIATGKRPFAADSDFALMVAHLELKPTPPIELDATLPSVLNDIILMAISKDPAQRFQSAAAFRNAVEMVRHQIGGMPIGSVPMPAVPLAGVADSVPSIASVGASAPTRTNVQPARAATAASSVAPAPPPLPPAPVAPHERGSATRAVYMALGSLATVGVLVAAFMFVPKYLRTRAGGRPASVEVPAQPVTPAASSQSTAAPAALSIPETAPKASDNVPSLAPAAPPQNTPAAQPAEQISPAPAPRNMRTPDRRPVHASAQNQPPQSPVPAQVAQQPQAAPPVRQQQPQPQAPPRPNAAEMNAIRQDYNQLAIRAGTAKSGLESLQNQMRGMTLRADIRETSARVDYLMDEAQASLRAGNLDDARRNLDLADQAVSKIEKFLGR